MGQYGSLLGKTGHKIYFKIQITYILQNSSYKTVIKGLYFLSDDQMCENDPYCGAKQDILESQYKF